MTRVVAITVLAVALAGGLLLASAALDKPSREHRRELMIDASAEKVWAVLTDFETYREWNPYVTEAEGAAVEGSTLRLHEQPARGEARTLSPEVVIARVGRKLRWQSRLLWLPGLRDEEREFRLEELGPERVRLSYEARVEGVMLPLWDDGEVERGYAGMLDALAARAESR